MKTDFKVGDRVYHVSNKNIIYTVEAVHTDGLVFVGYSNLGPSPFSVYRHVTRIDFSKPVTTRDGRPVRILCTDRKEHPRSVVALITQEGGKEIIYTYFPKGNYQETEVESVADLINPPVKKYINLFKNDVGRMYYNTLEEAEKSGNASKNAGYVKTIEVEL